MRIIFLWESWEIDEDGCLFSHINLFNNNILFIGWQLGNEYII